MHIKTSSLIDITRGMKCGVIAPSKHDVRGGLVNVGLVGWGKRVTQVIIKEVDKSWITIYANNSILAYHGKDKRATKNADRNHRQ